MDVWALYLKLFLAFLFLSTAWSKRKTIGEHIGIVRDYRILPNFLVEPFAKWEVDVEMGIGILLVIGLFQKFDQLLLMLLLLSYSIAIATNLFRGRYEMSCGCGGAAGDHTLSWWLVLRNVILLGAGGFVFVINPTLGNLDALWHGAHLANVWNTEALIVMFLALSSILIWSGLSAMSSLRAEIKINLKKES